MDFIMVPRSIFEAGEFEKERYTKREAFLDLVQMASFDTEEKVVNGESYRTERGQLVASRSFLSQRWGWDKNTVKRFLANMEASGRCTQGEYLDRDGRNTKPITLITITDYDVFQGNTPVPEPEKKGRKKSADAAPKEKAKRFIPPTVEEVEAYCIANGYDVNATKFVNYYSSIGWVVGKAKTPMKDWKASVRTWVANSTKYSGNNQQPTQKKGMVEYPSAYGSAARKLKPQDV